MAEKIGFSFNTDLSDVFKDLEKLGTSFKELRDSAKQSGKDLSSAFKDSSKGVEDLNKGLQVNFTRLKVISETSKNVSDELDKLDKYYASLKNSQKKFTDGSKDYQALGKEISKVEQRIEEVREEQEGYVNESAKLRSVRDTIKKTVDEAKKLEFAYIKLKEEQSKYTKGSIEHKAIQKEINATKTKLDELNNSSKNAAGGTGLLGRSFAGLKTALFSFAAPLISLFAIFGAIKKLISANTEFEVSLSNLSSITGLVGDDLKFLANEAKTSP